MSGSFKENDKKEIGQQGDFKDESYIGRKIRILYGHWVNESTIQQQPSNGKITSLHINININSAAM